MGRADVRGASRPYQIEFSIGANWRVMVARSQPIRRAGRTGLWTQSVGAGWPANVKLPGPSPEEQMNVRLFWPVPTREAARTSCHPCSTAPCIELITVERVLAAADLLGTPACRPSA